MRILEKAFGKTSYGSEVTAFKLQNNHGICAVILDYGCTIQALTVPDKNGIPVDVVLGYDTIEEYCNNDGYLGAEVGRHANRISKGEFWLNGNQYRLAVNNGKNHLHGGMKGFDKYVWNHRIDDGDSITFYRTSPDGEEGYPGTVKLEITYRLTGCGLEIAYHAVSDADTVLNLTNHSYFNLNGKGDVLNHILTINADDFTENDSDCLPTGRILPVEGTPMDFRMPKAIGQEIASYWPQVALFDGYDHNFVLNGSGFRSVARLTSPDSGITMEVVTTKPGVQLYTANGLSQRKGKGGACYQPHSAACLETQFFPNAMSCTNFPSPVLQAGERYSHRTAYLFTI